MSVGGDVFRDPEDWVGEEEGRRRADERRRRVAERAYRHAFRGEPGQRVLDDLITRFAGESYCRGDPHHTAYREGQRSVVEHIAGALARAEREVEEPDNGRSVD